jgi:hypothetical protein
MQPSPFTTKIAEEHAAELRERAGEQRAANGARPVRAARSRQKARQVRQAGIALRMVDADREPAVRRLAALDERPVPAGPVLLADVDGRPRAALAFADGQAIADPFFPSAELVALLRLRAVQLRRVDEGPHRFSRLLARTGSLRPGRGAGARAAV